MNSLFDSALFGFLTLVKHDEIAFCNNTLYQWIGRNKDQPLEGTSFTDLVSVGNRIFLQTHVFPLLELQKQVREIQLEFICADGSRFPALINANVEFNEKGEKEIRMLCIDFRQRKRFEAELIAEKRRAEDLSTKLTQTNRELSLFAYAVSHDLRGPLGNVRNFAEILESNRSSEWSPTAVQALQFIKISTDQLLNMVEAMLNSYQAGHSYASSLEPVFMEDWVSEVMHIFQKNETFTWQFEGKNDQVHINKAMLSQVIINLISNANRYSDKDRTDVKITFRKTPEWLKFSVKDNGSGISEADQATLFTKSFSGKKIDRHGVKGTGFGLVTVKKIVEGAGGVLSLHSTVGVGTEIEFSIPVFDPS